MRDLRSDSEKVPLRRGVVSSKVAHRGMSPLRHFAPFAVKKNRPEGVGTSADAKKREEGQELKSKIEMDSIRLCD